MSDYTDYADRVSERYGVLQSIGQPDATEQEGHVPLYVRRGPEYLRRDWNRFQDSLDDARRRVREDQIKELLGTQPRLELAHRTAFGPPTSLAEVVRRESRVVLLGEAGAGKTTALRSLVAHLSPTGDEDAGRLTILVDLPGLAASGRSLPEYLSEDAEQNLDLALPADFFQGVLTYGQAWLFLDGLDEIAGQGQRNKVIGLIESWIERFPRCWYVVTARADAYESALSRDAFAHYVLVPWSDTVDADLERTWGEVSEEWTEEETEEQLSSAPRLLQDAIAARSLEAMVAEGGVDAVWTEIRPHLWDVTWRERLALTWRFLAQDHPEAWARLLGRVLDVGLNDPLKLVLRRHLRVAATALAASDVSDELDQNVRKRVVDGLVDWMTDPQAAGRQDAADAMFRLGNEPYAFERAAQLIGDTSLDEWSREAGVLLLGELGKAHTNEAVEALRACLDNDEESDLVRQSAGTSLGQLGSSAVLDDELQAAVEEDLIARIRDSELPIGLRVAIGETLGLIVAETRRDAILEVLTALARAENEGEQKVPYAVQMSTTGGLCAVLSTTDDAQFVEQMWELARDEEVDDAVRSTLAEALGKRDNAEEAAHILLELAQSTEIYPPGRRDAMRALGRLGYSDQSIVEGLVAIAETRDRKIKDFERLAAACALDQIGHLDLATQHLLQLIADKSIYRSTRNDALTYLGELGFSGDEDLDNATVAVLQIWVTEENTTEDVRECAMQSLCLLGVNREEVVRDLIGVVQDRGCYPRVRRAAVETLGILPVEQKEMVVDALGATLYDADEKSDLLRVPIARLLVLWGEDENALTYIRAAAEQSYMAPVRYKAAMILGELGEVELASSTLLKLAQDTKVADFIRCDSLRALGMWMVGDEQIVDEIKSILQEEDVWTNVREAVYTSLKSITAV